MFLNNKRQSTSDNSDSNQRWSATKNKKQQQQLKQHHLCDKRTTCDELSVLTVGLSADVFLKSNLIHFVRWALSADNR